MSPDLTVGSVYPFTSFEMSILDLDLHGILERRETFAVTGPEGTGFTKRNATLNHHGQGKTGI